MEKDRPVRLNPFYFRAGLLPLIAKARRMGFVLIPFISGLDCYIVLTSSGLRFFSLNPFYFRAGLLPARQAVQAITAVLIPFISGLDCYRIQGAQVEVDKGS